MQSDLIADLDLPGASMHLSSPISPYSMTFLHRNQTQAQVVDALYKLIYLPETSGHRIWLLTSQVECILAIVASILLLVRKKTYGLLWLIARRESMYGTFYVTNSVFCLVIGVAGYLSAWVVTGVTAATFSFVGISSNAWWWTVPAPWAPLVVGGYVSMHGFVIGCSPRSPLSPFSAVHRDKWYYLPIPKSPAVVNTTLVLPPVLFLIGTFVLCVLAGHTYHDAKALAADLLPVDILTALTRTAHHKSLDASFATTLASDQLLWAARRVAAAYLDVHRHVCINLLLSCVAAFCIFTPSVLYGLPNSFSLVDHACSRTPTPPPATLNHVEKSFWLITKGRPKSTVPGGCLSANAWRMTLFAQMYVMLVMLCSPLFGFVPIFIVANSFPRQMYLGDFTSTLRAAIIVISLIIFVTVVFYVSICGVFTLEPLFRSAMGVSLLRNQIPIDVKVVASQTDRAAAGQAVAQPVLTIFVHDEQDVEEEQADPAPPKVEKVGLTIKPSLGSLRSTSFFQKEAEDTASTVGTSSPITADFECTRHVQL